MFAPSQFLSRFEGRSGGGEGYEREIHNELCVDQKRRTLRWTKRGAAVAVPTRGRGGNDVDERKKKDVFLLYQRKNRQLSCVLFFKKQMHFLNFLILIIGFTFATYHTSM